MTRRRLVPALVAAVLTLLAPIALAPPASAGPPAGTCGASEGCGCGGVYVLKFKVILAHC